MPAPTTIRSMPPRITGRSHRVPHTAARRRGWRCRDARRVRPAGRGADAGHALGRSTLSRARTGTTRSRTSGRTAVRSPCRATTTRGTRGSRATRPCARPRAGPGGVSTTASHAPADGDETDTRCRSARVTVDYLSAPGWVGGRSCRGRAPEPRVADTYGRSGTPSPCPASTAGEPRTVFAGGSNVAVAREVAVSGARQVGAGRALRTDTSRSSPRRTDRRDSLRGARRCATMDLAAHRHRVANSKLTPCAPSGGRWRPQGHSGPARQHRPRRRRHLAHRGARSEDRVDPEQ